MPFLLEMTGVNKSFSGNQVLRNVNFTCRAGEIHGLMGENGAGKSTLMKILAGVYSLDSGSIAIEGKIERFNGYDQARRAGVCVVYQELSLLPHLSVAENIYMGRWGRGVSGLIKWRDIHAGARQALAKVGLESLDTRLLTGSLPMAMRQLVEVAKALLYEPRIVVFDEPTTTLTEEEASRLFDLMAALRAQGKGIIFISHRLKEILQHTDRITIMKDGEKVLTDTTSFFNEHKLIVHMIGRDLTDIYPPKSQPAEQVIFTYRGNSGKDGAEISFSIREGEVLGVGGLAGQGQIPMLESIFGMGPADQIEVTVRGETHRIRNPRDAMHAGIALIPEDRQGQAMFSVLSIAENIASSSVDRHSVLGFIRRGLELREVREIAGSLKVKMTSLRQEVMYLSGGNIQKTMFARWLLAKPRVMVLISPTSGIDIGTKQQIYSLIRELANSGVAIIMMTGDMMELIGMCDRVLVMYDGTISGILGADDISEGNIMKTSMRRTAPADREVVND